MKNQEVAKLIKSKESGLVEFKETFDREAVETIGAFANTKGISKNFQANSHS